MTRITSLVLVLTLSSALLAAEPLNTDSWPAWRGDSGHGSTDSGSYASSWQDGKNLIWKTKLPGPGCSTPVIWKRQILLTTPLEERDAVLALDWDGKTLWQTEVGKYRRGKHRNGSSCNPSVATDGDFVFAYFKSGNLAGLTLDGKLLWSTNLQERFGKDTLYWDLGTSPVITSHSVVVAVMHSGESFLIGFEKATGKQLWKTGRQYKTPVEGDHSYATPTVATIDGMETLVVWGAEHLTGHRVTDGKLLWSVGGFNPQKRGNWVVVASAVTIGDIAIVPYGRGSHLAGVKLGGNGDMTDRNRVWTRDDTGTFVPTPAVYKGRVYLVRDKGEVVCIDPQNGSTIWENALPKHRAKYYSSPLIADDKIYAVREDGVVLVASIKENFEVLSENDMGERVIASPVAIADRLFLRGQDHLYCIGKK